MAYRLAHSLEKLRGQINSMAPNRSKASDGWIGDSSHFATGSASDHNPWVKLGGTGIVTAYDFTHDPAHGCDVMAIANAIVKSRDRRLKYLIYTGGAGGRPGILSSTVSPWTWRTRANDDHPHHLHISVDSNAADFDSVAPWSIRTVVPPTTEDDAQMLTSEAQKWLEARIKAYAAWTAQNLKDTIGRQATVRDAADVARDTALNVRLAKVEATLAAINAKLT